MSIITGATRPDNRHQRRRRAALYFNPASRETLLRHVSAMEAVSDDDRDWFLANPGRSYRLRPIAEAEIAVDGRRRPSAESGLAGYTVVKQVVPGVRVRACFMAPAFHRPEAFSDAACAMLFAEIEAKREDISAIVKAISSTMGGR